MQYQSPNQKYELSKIVISATCYMARDLISYFIAVWPSPDLFSQDEKMDFCKDSFH